MKRSTGTPLGTSFHAQHDGMGGRADVKANHIVQFLRKGGIVRKLELTPATRAQAVRLPDRPHSGGCQIHLRRHGAQRPVRRLVWRWFLRQTNDLRYFDIRYFRNAWRARLFPQEAVDALACEALSPASNTFFGLTRHRDNRHRTQPVPTQMNNSATPNVLMRCRGPRDDRFKSGSVRW